MKITTAILAGFILGSAACGRDLPVRQLSDYELAQMHRECMKRKPTAPGAATACTNIQRECERRFQARGNYLCAK